MALEASAIEKENGYEVSNDEVWLPVALINNMHVGMILREALVLMCMCCKRKMMEEMIHSTKLHCK
jgi:hypothetical protein